MPAEYPVVDLSASPDEPDLQSLLQASGAGSVNLDQLREQLSEIRDALNPVLAEQHTTSNSFRLRTMELDLTVGLEGQVWFVAKGKGEASLKLTWSRAG